MTLLNKILFVIISFIFLIIFAVCILFLLVDPNQYKSMIVTNIENQTGLQTRLESDLRWHFWPKPSLIAHNVTLNQIQNEHPILTADNIRFDVDFLPLLSKKIRINNILINHAIINLAKQNDWQKSTTKATINKQKVFKSTILNDNLNTNLVTHSEQKNKNSFPLNSIKINNSQLFFEYANKLVNIRDLNLTIIKNDNFNHNYLVKAKAFITRDNKNFNFDLASNLDFSFFPTHLNLNLEKFNYNYDKQKDNKKISGNLTANLNYDLIKKELISDSLIFSTNNNLIEGKFKFVFDDIPYINASLVANDINLNSFFSNSNNQKVVKSNTKNTEITKTDNAQIVVNKIKQDKEFEFLHSINANINLKFKNLIFNQIEMNNIAFKAKILDGTANVEQMDFNLADGRFISKGVINQNKNEVNFDVIIDNADINALLTTANLPHELEGRINASGNIRSNTFNLFDDLTNSVANFYIDSNSLMLKKINIEEMIFLNFNKKRAEKQLDHTQFNKFNTRLKLQNNQLNFDDISASTNEFSFTGNGAVNLYNKEINSLLNISLSKQISDKITSNSVINNYIANAAIPLQIKGNINELQYKVKLDIQKIMQKLFKQKIKHPENLIENNK